MVCRDQLPTAPTSRETDLLLRGRHGRCWALRTHWLEKNQLAALLEVSTDVPSPGAASVPVCVLTALQMGHAAVLLGCPATVTATAMVTATVTVTE